MKNKNIMHVSVRYHLKLSSHRTTISLDKILSDLLAIHLGVKPETVEAYQAVRKKLEEFIAHDLGRSGKRLSHYLTEKVILTISDKFLSEKYQNYFYG